MTDKDFKSTLGNLMQTAQEMQKKMEELQKKISETEVSAESGAGAVKVKVNGKYRVTSLTINPELLEEDITILQDLVMAAVNEAVRKMSEKSEGSLKDLAATLKIPGDAGTSGSAE